MKNRESGQIVVLFALFLIVLVGIAGLVLDGGGTYAQRRSEQNAADLAALGGANLQLNGGGSGAVVALAHAIAKENGFEHGVAGTTVNVVPTAGQVKVDINAPHTNYFSGVWGMREWPVSVTATASWGVPQGVSGNAPIIFSEKAFDPATGLPYQEYGCATACSDADAVRFEHDNSNAAHAPEEPDLMAWTVLGDPHNLNTSDLRAIINGTAVQRKAPILNQYIGQHNSGQHTPAFGDVNTYLAGKDVVVPIIGEPIAPATECAGPSGLPNGETNGCFHGWALFHITSAAGGSDKAVYGYFKTGMTRVGSDVPLCTAGASCPGFHGLYVLRLTN